MKNTLLLQLGKESHIFFVLTQIHAINKDQSSTLVPMHVIDKYQGIVIFRLPNTQAVTADVFVVHYEIVSVLVYKQLCEMGTLSLSVDGTHMYDIWCHLFSGKPKRRTNLTGCYS